MTTDLSPAGLPPVCQPYEPIPNERDIPCPACGGEGRFYSGHPNDPNPRESPCDLCNGTGGIVEDCPLIDEDDAAERAEMFDG